MKEIIVLKKMYAEIRKWEKMPGTSLYKSMRLLKLYIGMGIDGFMTRDGKILCQDFNPNLIPYNYFQLFLGVFIVLTNCLSAMAF